jgi:hypothetical protein
MDTFMRTLSVVILVAAITFCHGTTLSQTKKYDIKSGIVTFETEMLIGKMKTTGKAIVLFDDYGIKECKETYEDNQLSEITFSDGKTIYLVKVNKKTAFKSGDAYRGTEYKCDWAEVSEKDKQSGKAKKLPARTIAGKSCEAFQVGSGSTVSVFAGWKGITLYSEVKTGMMNVISRAVKIEENAAVPASKFQVPVGYSIR